MTIANRILIVVLVVLIISHFLTVWIFLSNDDATSLSSLSGTSGQLFDGDRIRIFDKRSPSRSSGRSEMLTVLPSPPTGCIKWGVVTTIYNLTDSIVRIAELPDFCVVVVADKKTPKNYPLIPGMVIIDEASQRLLTSQFALSLPWNHFGRKNLGYLYAIAYGAQVIFDFDDDNLLKQGERLRIPVEGVALSGVCSSINVYPLMGASAWPRGLPLPDIKCVGTVDKRSSMSSVAVVQSLADNDPDVDAIFRLTRSLPVHFDVPKGLDAVKIPRFRFSPYNAQASLHDRRSMWGLLLPVTVHGRVSDIWRSYVTQRLLWDVNLDVAFSYPMVDQYRNPHNYLQDMDAEKDLYFRSSALVQFLSEWRSNEQMIEVRLETLWIEMYERGFVEIEDVVLIQQWISELHLLDYTFPIVTIDNSVIMREKKVSILITGINGMLGSHLARVLLSGRFTVSGLVRPRSNLDLLESAIDLFECDITDSVCVHQVIAKVKPGIIYHFAAADALTVNVKGTLNVLEAIRAEKLHTRVLLAGSAAQYNLTDVNKMRSEVLEVDEMFQFEPITLLGVGKVAMELLGHQYFLAYKMDIVTARLFTQLGAGGTDTIDVQDMARQIALMERGVLPPFVRVDEEYEVKRDYSDASDTVHVLIALATLGVAGEAYNVGNGATTSAKDILDEMMALSTRKVVIEIDPRRHCGAAQSIGANTGKLKELGIQSPKINPKETAKRLLEYWRSEIDRLYSGYSAGLDQLVRVYATSTTPLGNETPLRPASPEDKYELYPTPSALTVSSPHSAPINVQNYFVKQEERVLITGVNGMIGSHVARFLVDRGSRVFGLVRSRSKLSSLAGILNRIILIQGDITDIVRMQTIMAEVRPTVVYHFAAQAINSISYKMPEATMDANIQGTFNVLEALRRTGLQTRVLLAGSSTEYGRTADIWEGPLPETAPFEPVSPYGVSKVITELLGRMYWRVYQMPIVCARFFIQVGVGGTDSLAFQDFSHQIALIEAKKIEPIIRHGNLMTRRDTSDIRDTVSVVVKLITSGIAGEAYNIGSGVAISTQELLNALVSLTKIPITTMQETGRMRVYDEKVLLADITKLKQLTGWSPSPNLPDTANNILSYWRNREIRPRVRAAFVTVFSERKQILKSSLPKWAEYVPWAHGVYPIIVFVWEGVSETVHDELKRLAGPLELRVVKFAYGWGQEGDHAGNGGGAWINFILAYGMFHHEALKDIDYLLRFDEDVFPYDLCPYDVFADMHFNGIKAGWVQHIGDNEVSLGSGIQNQAIEYAKTSPFKLSDTWSLYTHPNSSHHAWKYWWAGPQFYSSLWRPYLVAGCIELYNINIFRNNTHYDDFWNKMNAEAGLKASRFWEQELKSLFIQMFVPLQQTRSYACALPVAHKDKAGIALWMYHSCHFDIGYPTEKRGHCDADLPLMRVC